MAKCKNCINLCNLSDDNDVIVGKWCPKVNDSPNTENERDCENYKCMTQADRIRSMSDEELAEFLREYFTCEYECAAAKAGCQRDCDGTIMEWLQSEVEK